MRPPGTWSDSWTCPTHAVVAPLHPPEPPADAALARLTDLAQVPVWLPFPLPVDWELAGMRHAGDEHTGAVATVVAFSGPNPLHLEGARTTPTAELLLVAEQPGIGLAAHLAGLTDVDPGDRVVDDVPAWRLVVAGHETPLWRVPVDEPSAFVGEAAGVWLWVLTWPWEAAAVLLEQFELRDTRNGSVPELPLGDLSPRLG